MGASTQGTSDRFSGGSAYRTVLHLVNVPYQQIRQNRGTRKVFFQDILSLTKYFLFNSWQHLIDFMLSDSDPSLATDSS